MFSDSADRLLRIEIRGCLSVAMRSDSGAPLLGAPCAASWLRLGFSLGLGRVSGLRGGELLCELLGQRSRRLLEGVSLLTQPAKILQDGVGIAVRHGRQYKGGKEIPATEKMRSPPGRPLAYAVLGPWNEPCDRSGATTGDLRAGRENLSPGRAAFRGGVPRPRSRARRDGSGGTDHRTPPAPGPSSLDVGHARSPLVVRVQPDVRQ